MNASRIVLRFLPAILAGALGAGCGRTTPATTAGIEELGLRLEMPAGWRTEPGNPRLLVEARNPDNHFGLIEDCPDDGQSLDAFVDDAIRLDAAAVRSRQPLTIGDYPAVEIVSEAEFALLEVFIHQDRRIIRISYRIAREALPIQGPALRRSLQSARFQPGTPP